MNAQKYLLDNNCDNLILNDRFGMNPTDRIYTSDIMEKYAKDYHESEVNKLKQGVVSGSVCVYCKGSGVINMMNHGEMPCVCKFPQTDH